MNVKTVIPLALAIVLGLFAAMAAKNMIDKNKNRPVQVEHFTQVVVAKDNVAAGTQLKADDLSVGKMAGDVPSDAVYGRPEEVIGRVLKDGVVRGQPILEPMLTPKGTGAGLQALVPEGMRSITIEVNDFSGVGGFLVPGCHVDMVATITGDDNQMLARTVVQNIKVQAVNAHLQGGPGSDPNGNPEPMKSITLVATPKEVEAIDLAARTGSPRFVLRASGDQSGGDSDGVTAAELRGKLHHSDPFSDVRAVGLNKAATKPSEWSSTRSISVIRAGVESQTNLQLDSNDRKWMNDLQKQKQQSDQDTVLGRFLKSMTGINTEAKPIDQE
ncbi:MAG: Flp pilus assembly protein CpaB [Phycisphaerae bacterium]|nr:Flp pilus assembly protein CpaB [Phycisphaerae bacterium]